MVALDDRGAGIDEDVIAGASLARRTVNLPSGRIGVDIGKEVFHVVGFGADGKIAFRKKIKRF
jgi:hypothetical protein